MQQTARNAGLLTESRCGDAVFTMFRMRDVGDFSERLFRDSPEDWYGAIW